MRKCGFLLVVVIMMAGAMAGCSKGGSEYEGKWSTSIRSDWDGTTSIERLDTTRNGENFIIKTSREQYEDTGVTIGEKGKKAAWKASAVTPVSATLKDGKLMISPVVGLTFVKSDGTILGPRGEIYTKDTPENYAQRKTAATETYKKLKPRMVVE
jgi:hypothetical protein